MFNLFLVQEMTDQYDMGDLLEIMAKLRDPENGCPWDVEQNFSSIAPYTIEEAYEVDEAIRNNDMASLKDELGDLLFQTVFHTQMAQEVGLFTFGDVVQSVSEKMVRRHPHVFGNMSIEDADAQTASWERLKAEERARKAKENGAAMFTTSAAYELFQSGISMFPEEDNWCIVKLLEQIAGTEVKW